MAPATEGGLANMTDELEIAKFVFSGFVGAAGALLVNGAASYYRRPILSLSFATNAQGCVVDTPCQRKDIHGAVVAQGHQRALRILVRNEGLTTAHNVCVTATELVV